MNAARLVFVGDDAPWLQVRDGAIVGRGAMFVRDQLGDDETLIAVTPAADVALTSVDLPGLSLPQACAAARHAVAEQSLLPGDAMFVACGDQEAGAPSRLVAVVDRRMIAACVAAFDPDVIVPAPLLLAEPAHGYVEATIGPQRVLRGEGTGFAHDDVLTPLVVGDAPIEPLSLAQVEAMIVAAAANPPINLRQGEFARRRAWDWSGLRRTAMLVAVVVLVSAAISLVWLIRFNAEAATLEATSASLAQAALKEPVAASAAVNALTMRLAQLRGGGAGFVATVSAVRGAVRATPNVELTSLTFETDGAMRIGLRAASAAEFPVIEARLRGAGLQVTPGVVNPAQGQPVTEVTVRGQ